QNMRDSGMDWGRFFRDPELAKKELRSTIAHRKRMASLDTEVIWSPHVEKRWKMVANRAALYAATMNSAFYQVSQVTDEGVPYVGLLKWKLPPEPDSNPRRLTPKQVDALHDYDCKNEFVAKRRRCLIWLSSILGLRPKSMAALKMADFELGARTKYVRVAALKGGKSGEMALPDQILDHDRPFMEYLAVRPDVEGDWFFVGKHHQHHEYKGMTSGGLRRDAEYIKRATGFPFSLYDLRRYRNWYEKRMKVESQVSAHANGHGGVQNVVTYRGVMDAEEQADGYAKAGIPGYRELEPVPPPFERMAKEETETGA
ncbi:MAG: tyrosine-type recombinase/integrase, partial [Thermoplasmatota archaeon]